MTGSCYWLKLICADRSGFVVFVECACRDFSGSVV